MTKAKSIFLLPDECMTLIYSVQTREAIMCLTDNDGCAHSASDILASPEHYADVQIIFSGWGAPQMNETLLNALPALKAFFFAAGTVRSVVTDAFWRREILLTNAHLANAIPVAQYTMASVIFALKQIWNNNRQLRQGVVRGVDIQGVYKGSKVGIVSLGAIGCEVCRLLSRLELDLLAYDPFASDSLFDELQVQKVDTLEDIFSQCDVVTLHAPHLPETEGMISRELLEVMPNGATLINTARGAIIDEDSLESVLRERQDLFAIIDVISDESGYGTSTLLALPNVFLTPHIAGSCGRECFRMGDMALEECRRYLSGEDALSEVNEKRLIGMA